MLKIIESLLIIKGGRMVKLTEDEKIFYEHMLEECPTDIIKEYYIKIFGDDNPPRRSRMISRLLDADWPEEYKEEFEKKYSKAKAYNKPQGGYILETQTLPEKDEFVRLLNSSDGFRKLYDYGDIVVFRYELVKKKIAYYDEYLGTYKTYPTYMFCYYTIDFKNKVLIIRNGRPNEYKSAVSKFKKTFSISIDGTINKKNYSPEDINKKLEQFVKDLKSVLVFERLIREGHKIADDNEYRADNIEPYKSCIERMRKYPDLQEMYLPLIRGNNTDIDVSYLSSIEIKPGDSYNFETLKIFEEYLDTTSINIHTIPKNYPVDVIIEGEPKKVNLRDYLVTSKIDDFKNLNIEGKEDIFDNNTIKLCIKAGATIKGLAGKLLYKGREYKFVIKHGINFKPERPDVFKLMPPKDTLNFEESFHRDIEMAYRDLFNIYKAIFLRDFYD